MIAPDETAEPFDGEAFAGALEEAVTRVFADGPLPPDRIAKLVRYGRLLAEASQTINLTRILDPEAMAIRHFLDACQLLPVLRRAKGPVLDMGTGGGIPGIPLAILRRDLRVIMIDGTAKKIRCVAEWIVQLGLKNAVALPERAEVHLKKNRYHALISRAAVKPPTLMEILQYTGPVAERVIFMEGAKVKKRIRDTATLAGRAGYAFDAAHPYRLPGMDRERHLLCYKRV